MSTPVDVLALLDAEIARETEGEFAFPRGRRLREVRDAVAELIEADIELDAARQALWESGGMGGAGRAAALNREIDAKERRAAALANASGAP